MRHRLWIWVGIVCILIVGAVIWWWVKSYSSLVVTPLGNIIKEKPLEKYTIENLTQRSFEPNQIIFDDVLATTSSYTTQMFHFTVDPTSSREAGLRGAGGKKVSGLAHLPAGLLNGKKFPVVVQLRGYAPKETYTSGVGTKRSAEVFAANGFISLAPDFLGFGTSDRASDNGFEDRFLTYTTALQLLTSISTIPFADTKNIFIWGHSNGGQIALTLAAILGEQGFPTTLWAPVTKPFPFNILAYTDEFDDGGKALRKSLAEFERDYNTDKYSFIKYLDRITVPLQIQQGTNDEEVPVWWSRDFTAEMERLGKTVSYVTHPGADHNMNGSWNEAVNLDMQFFRAHLR